MPSDVERLTLEIDRFMVAARDSAAAFLRFNRALEKMVAEDLASLNQTQRAIYFAHRRGGLGHFDIMEIM